MEDQRVVVVGQHYVCYDLLESQNVRPLFRSKLQFADRDRDMSAKWDTIVDGIKLYISPDYHY